MITEKHDYSLVVRNMESGARPLESCINQLHDLWQFIPDLDVLIRKMGIRMLGRINELRYVECIEQCQTRGECSVGDVIVILLLVSL